MKYLVRAAVLILVAGLAGNFERQALGYSQAESEMLSEAEQELDDGSEHLHGFRSSYNLDAILAAYPDDEPNLLRAKELFEQLRDAQGLEEQAIEGLDETVYWLLKGAALLGNDDVVQAYGMRYDPNGGGDLSDEYAVFEDAVADYSKGTRYLKDFAEYPQDFEPGTFKEMINVLFRQGMARNEIAERHFALGDSPTGPTELKKAGQELRRCSQEAYLGAAVLTAIQNESDFQAYQVGRLRTNAVRAANTFKKLAAGLSAAGFHRDYIPIHPYVHCTESYGLGYKADQASLEALTAAEDAQDASRLVDEDEDALNTALAEIRGDVKTELDALAGETGNPPVYLTDIYFPEGANLDDPAEIAAFAQAACEVGGGDLTQAILENQAAMASFNAAYTALQNIPRKIQIEQDTWHQIAIVRKGTAEELGALEIAKGFANAFSFTATVEASIPPSGSVSVNFNPGSIVTGFCDAEARMLEAMQEVQIEGIETDAAIKLYLLDMAEQALALREYEVRVKQTKLKIDNLYKRLLALVEEWRRSLADVASAYYADPAYRLEMEDEVRQANIELEQAQVKCFLAARALSYDWADDFAGAALDAPYNQFDTSWSVFELTDADEVRYFYEALTEWDYYNRGESGNPCMPGEEKYQTISLREHILGFSDFDAPPEVKAENRRRFKQFIRDHTGDDDKIRFEFATSIADQSLFPIDVIGDTDLSNCKIWEIAANLRGALIVDPNYDEAEMGLTLAGMSTVRQCGADWPDNDSLIQYDLEGFGAAALRTVALTTYINGFPDDAEINWDNGLARLSVAATAWKAEISKAPPKNDKLNWDELTDIQFRIKYWYGWPPTPDEYCPGAMAQDANSVEPIDNEE